MQYDYARGEAQFLITVSDDDKVKEREMLKKFLLKFEKYFQGREVEQGGGGESLHQVHELPGHRLREGDHQARGVVMEMMPIKDWQIYRWREMQQ